MKTFDALQALHVRIFLIPRRIKIYTRKQLKNYAGESSHIPKRYKR